MKLAIALLLSLSFVANAEDCNKIEQKKADKLVTEYPLDDYAVKLAALRTGLCYYIKGKKISVERAGDLFEIEKQKMINEKFNENLKPIT
jgi:hypothetical protein